jgi:hypothetical protein
MMENKLKGDGLITEKIEQPIFEKQVIQIKKGSGHRDNKNQRGIKDDLEYFTYESKAKTNKGDQSQNHKSKR